MGEIRSGERPVGEGGQDRLAGLMKLRIETAGLSDRGLVRENNEDRIFFSDWGDADATSPGSFGLYVVADGMGGHLGGEVASTIAVETISALVVRGVGGGLPAPAAAGLLRAAFEAAHRTILERSESDPRLSLMGTTATAVLRIGLRLYVGHVGDSRAYHVTGGRDIIRLTRDHSVVGELVRQGVITEAEARIHPERGVLVRCLGVTTGLTVDTSAGPASQEYVELRAGDAVVLCSDGLTDNIADEEILEYARRFGRADTLCRELIRLANNRGGWDNASVVVMRTASDR